jgi:hypothetical protein
MEEIHKHFKPIQNKNPWVQLCVWAKTWLGGSKVVFENP